MSKPPKFQINTFNNGYITREDSENVDIKRKVNWLLDNAGTPGPQGPPGADGADGINGADGDITWEGEWQSQNYTANQAVYYPPSKTSYVCKLNTVANDLPTDPTYWDILAPQGEKGDQGDPGVGIGEAPNDGTSYVRKDEGWESIFEVIQQSVVVNNYGTTYTAPAGVINTHIVFSGSGTGLSTVDLAASDVGSIVTISDADRKCQLNNIKVDTGLGKVLTGTSVNTRYGTMRVNGQSVTMQKVTSTKWMVLSGI